ncbi:MAG: hypothetical protein A3G02_02370 [Candidatus Yanofskybacteria bacterium RIFCSPLOWO2_12_FULL_44_13b]|uniref:HTH psq-type domain-containing protein n=2 Tax=Candidatus Yanofskyibacteriota TaxID=1752733 RepID=A0A1F8H2A2_9BACT|nr:MAG: hypothetical protein UW14_C0014G0013 [Candidatus Yanofskybacteria bacterium GW2011_GWA2_44_10]KKT89967.1 MAG: hypothetical protein UW90_C0010G0014 [Candidatus Yanofskybacteria bacterium GW2011_GWB1_45_11]OGN02078.1 MAG: hypothetical protein A2657_01925 [Candidatus Yanofskybacteria bacterium RIFCSPHIGHO2_01_FULL_44_110b]OGN18513.1 MAG: hypothetical protein A3F50_02080 [Candidatus Yanofskybacteria bacterium RIFCSPHIGHO2_12_FULL_44_29b]OGN26465.1 MAG: hypothetical protein A3B12_02965 [Cand
MVQYKINQKKNMAISLRRGGYSYSEIQKMVPVAKATLSLWLKNEKMSEPQIKRLFQKKQEAMSRGLKTRKQNVRNAIEKIRESSAKEIGSLSKRDVWLLGLAVYWRERFLNKSDEDLIKGVRFTSSDPSLIKLFLKWLREIGGLSNEEIVFDLFVKNRKARADCVKYWAAITSYPAEDFTRVYVQKMKAKFGLLRVRVRASSMLARQVSGWIHGIEKEL